MLIRSSPVPVLDHKSLNCRQICRAALETAPSYGPVNMFSVTLTYSYICVCVSSCPKFLLGSLNQQQQQLQLATLMTKTMCWVEAFSAASLGKPARAQLIKRNLIKVQKYPHPAHTRRRRRRRRHCCARRFPLLLSPTLSAPAWSVSYQLPTFCPLFLFKAQVHMQILKSFAATFFTCTNYKKYAKS